MGQRLLVVDSDRSFLKEHQVSLEAAFDVDVSMAPDGALPKLEGGGYAAALICVEVAENKGYALCSAIRKNPRTAGLKIALISAKATEEEYRRHQSLKGRADLYLHKPMAPGALVAALSQVVPPRPVDPDNPLGDLTGDLGEEWLDSLKDELDGAPATAPVTNQTVAISMDMLRQAGVTPLEALPRSATTPIPVLPAEPQAGTVALDLDQVRAAVQPAALQPTAVQPAAVQPAAMQPAPVEPRPETPPASPALEARVQELEAQVFARSSALELAEAEIERLTTELELSRQAESSATKNLDEAERLMAELEQLRGRIKEREEALQRTREDYDALQRSHDSITQNLDDLERRQEEAETLRTRLAQAEEALARLEQSSAREGEGSEALKSQLRQSIEEHHELLQQVEQLNNQMAEKNQRVIGLLKERDRLQQQALEAESQQNRAQALEREKQDLEGALAQLRTKHEELERGHGELQARQDELGSALEAERRQVQAHAERVQALEWDLEGKEATLRAQGRDLADQEARAKALDGEAESLRGRVAELEAGQRAQEEEKAQQLAARDRLMAACTDLERQLGKAVGQHEAERMELLEGLDAKEAEIGRLKEAIEGARQTAAGLQSEIASLQSALADRNDRLGALASVLGDLGEKIQRGSDLTRA